ncbi:MAG: pantoate--beta-alanine ligase [Bacillota bacterium]
MDMIKTVAKMRDWTDVQRKPGRSIGLVPTMGYLHEGHLSLVQKARVENEAVVMSIFVNPLQFGPHEDYATYPRDLDMDCRLAESAGVDVVFYPEPPEIYPQYPPLTIVEVKEISEGLCGASRPGHFTGVATVVSKLFNIVQPHRAYFGQKDYQQVQVIKRMVTDLNIPVSIQTVPIKREADGLAMSSRNTYLYPSERQEALCLYQALKICRKMYDNGEKKLSPILEAMKARILREPSAVIDYVEICDATSLAPVTEIKGPVVALLAVRIGKTRLIDNLLLGVE